MPIGGSIGVPIHKAPNETTMKAMEELRAGKGHAAATVADLMAALDADD